MQLIRTPLHGVLDYLVGIALVAAPWIFQFADVEAAKWVAIGSGIALIALSLLTNYELGLVPVVPMHVHLALDALLGVFLIASPWIFGFADDGTNAWLPHVAVGIAELGVAALSRPWPEKPEAAERERRLVHRAA
jgi:hypothetical protein